MKHLYLLLLTLTISVISLAQRTTGTNTAPGTTPVTPDDPTTVECTFIVSIEALGSTEICPGTHVRLTTQTGLGYTYQWLRDDQPIPGANNSFFDATMSGDYSVIIYTRTCRGESVQMPVTMRPTYAFDPLPDQTVSCNNSITLDAGNTYNNYTWNIGQSGSVLQVNVSGDYLVTASDPNGCILKDSTNVSLLSTNIEASQTTLCSGDTVQVCAVQTGISPIPLSYQWSNGQHADCISYMPAQSSSLILSVSNGSVSCIQSIDFNVLTPSFVVNQQNACGSFTWHGNTYTQTGVYYFHGVNAVGCDSTEALYLQVSQAPTRTLNIFACGSYPFYGEFLTLSGTYIKVVNNPGACDSIITLHLSIGQSNSSEESVTTCDSYAWNGQTYTESGDYTFVTTNGSGCDSIITLHLNILESTGSNTTIVTDQPYQWNGQYFDVSGIYVFNTTNSLGCDSLAVLTLTITNGVDCTITASDTAICSGESVTLSVPEVIIPTGGNGGASRFDPIENLLNASYTWSNGQTTSSIVVSPTETTTYTVTVSNGYQTCTGSVTIYVNQPTSSSLIINSCGSYSWNGNTYNQSGTYTWTGTNVNGCDSIATLNLTINQPSASNEYAAACGSYTWNGNSYNQSGIYTWTGINVNGCDSIATLNLTINQPSESYESAAACGSYSWNGNTYNQSGTYAWTGTNAAGCDSIVNLQLEIHQPTSSEETVSVCALAYTWNGNAYYQSGDYNWTGTNANGCDSIVTLHLILNHPSESTETITACGAYIWNDNVYSQSGTYTWTGTNAAGCDSIVTLNLTINSLSVSADAIIASAQNVQPGASVNLQVLGGQLGTGANWYWTQGMCQGMPVGQGSSINVNPTVTTTYYVYAEGECNVAPCTSITITVSDCNPHQVSSNASGNSICAGGSANLQVTGNASNWAWFVGGCNSGSPIGFGSNISVSPSVTTTYYVRGEGIACGSSNCNSITIYVNHPPHINGTISGPLQGACQQQNAVFSISPVANAASYTWTVPTGAVIISGQGTSSITVNLSGIRTGNCSTNYNLNICVNASNECGVSNTICATLTLAPVGQTTISGPTTVIRHQIVTYTCTPVAGANIYRWTVPGGWVIISGQGSRTISVRTGYMSGSVRVIPGNDCGNAATACLPVHVNATGCGNNNSGSGDDDEEEDDDDDEHDDDRSSAITSIDVKAYPNPSSDIMHLNAGAQRLLMVQLIDLQGNVKMVIRNSNVINLSNVISGQYLLRCHTDKGIVNKNIVVVH